jgi:transposase
MSSLQHREDLVHVAFDASKNVVVAGVLRAQEETPTIERIFNDEPSIRRVLRGFPERAVLRTCYEAGPGGYELHRLLTTMKVACEVIAPSLIPTAPGDRVKTDKRDARRLVRQLRADELVAIRVPTRQEEAVRDLCRVRADAVEDLTRAKNRLAHFLIRHGRIYRDGTTWTLKHRSWLAAQSFDHPALHGDLRRYTQTVQCREAELGAIEADMTTYRRTLL